MEIAAGWADTLLVPAIVIVGLAVIAFILRTWLRGNTHDRKVGFADRDGQPRATMREQNDRSPQNAAGLIHTHHQITSMKSDSLGLMASGMAHDFNNFLTSILGNATLARMEIESDSLLDSCLAEIETTSLQASELCNQLLLYSGKGRLNVVHFDLQNLIADMKPIIQELAGPNISLQFDLAGGPHPVEADSDQVRKMIQNLVKNASDAIGDEPGRICVTLDAASISHDPDSTDFVTDRLEPGGYSYIRVSDTGSGMTPDVQARVFDPFFTTKPAFRGLGLTAVLGIIRGHKAGLKLESELNKGSTFTVFLPVAADLPQNTTSQTDNNERWQGMGTVLIIEDDAPIRKITTRMLSSFGFDVLQAKDGISGIEIFQEHAENIVLILLDLTMPRMSGHEVRARIKAIRPNAQVVLMSGQFEPEVTNLVSHGEIAGFVQKPFKREDLQSVLENALKLADGKS